jgi:hypothetical protein
MAVDRTLCVLGVGIGIERVESVLNHGFTRPTREERLRLLRGL